MVREILSIDAMCPAAGQGALAIEIRAGDDETRRYLSSLDHAAARAMTEIHQSDLAASSISTRQPTLDDVYLQLTGTRLAEAA